MNDTVPRFPGVYRRNDSAVWQFGLKPPKDLHHHFPGTWAVRCSLATSDLREANDRARELHAEWAARFAELRRRDNPQRVNPSPELSATIAAELRRWVLQADDHMRSFPEGPRALLIRQSRKERIAAAAAAAAAAAHLPDTLRAALADALPAPSALLIGARRAAGVTEPEETPPDALAGLTADEHGALARMNAEGAGAAAIALARQNLRAVLPLADDVARSLGYLVDWTTPEGRECLRECLRAHAGATGAAAQRDAGAVVDTPPAGAIVAPPAPRKGHSFRNLFEEWHRLKPDRPVKTVQTYEAAAAKLEALLPGRIVESLTREDGRTIEGALRREAQARGGKAINTAANLLGRFKTLLAQGVDLEWIDKNPLQGRTIESTDSDRREWLPAELARLFDDPLFTAYRLPPARRAGMDAAYWLPLLGLYTGARISELAQLHTDDLVRTPEAGWVLQITADDGAGQRLKTAESKRSIPLHPELERLGLVDYWRAIKAHGAGPLFPAVVRSTLNGAGGKVSQWFGEFKTSKGFDGSLVFHSFRHTLQTRLLALGVPESHADALAGHAGATVGRRSYTDLTPADLRPSLERLAFPAAAALPRVFSAPAWRPGLLSTDNRQDQAEHRGRSGQQGKHMRRAPGG